ncbi:hypothetical protein FRC12_021253 [Ceratobasidium sp. 428]|nr:hypothetical protein FRC12_021253 [Ceratobasidium sp. 428]
MRQMSFNLNDITPRHPISSTHVLVVLNICRLTCLEIQIHKSQQASTALTSTLRRRLPGPESKHGQAHGTRQRLLILAPDTRVQLQYLASTYRPTYLGLPL